MPFPALIISPYVWCVTLPIFILTHKNKLLEKASAWDSNIKMDFRDTGCGLDLAASGHNPLVGLCEHCNDFHLLD
jgi:hypothetical protein